MRKVYKLWKDEKFRFYLAKHHRNFELQKIQDEIKELNRKYESITQSKLNPFSFQTGSTKKKFELIGFHESTIMGALEDYKTNNPVKKKSKIQQFISFVNALLDS